MKFLTPIALENLILFNLYYHSTRSTGLIDLHDIDVLVNRYKKGERNLFPRCHEVEESLSLQKENDDNSSPIAPVVAEVLEPSEPSIINEDSSSRIDQNTNIDQTTNIVDQSRNLMVNNVSNHGGADNIDQFTTSATNQDTDKNNQSESKITADIERLIFELYLEELAETVVKPSQKALSSSLKPNLQKLNGRKLF